MTDNPYEIFDPLMVENIGVTLAIELLEQPVHPVPPSSPFLGAGIYALYYSGNHPDYKQLVALDANKNKYPIYIGKAVRKNAKQGFNPQPTTGTPLFGRIQEHSESIKAGGLNLSDFQCRFLVVQDAYVALAESVLIMVFRPPWNGMGFGSKVVGKHRMTGKPSLWDSLHQGRLGRPAGTKQNGINARKHIQKCLQDLQKPHKDPRAQRMLDRIMKFV